MEAYIGHSIPGKCLFFLALVFFTLSGVVSGSPIGFVVGVAMGYAIGRILAWVADLLVVKATGGVSKTGENL